MIRKVILIGVAVPVLLVGGIAAYAWTTLHFSYSSGDRSGYVQKLSKKGWVCKTWEGELAMVSMPGTAPEIFYFSVRGDDIAAKLNQTLGKRVAIHYEQAIFFRLVFQSRDLDCEEDLSQMPEA